MTAAARRVLADCEAALEMLEDVQDEQRWRVLWIGAMALLRAVGHILRKVDGEALQQVTVINAAYERWNAGQAEHAVFREFIEKERNNILKEYRLSVLDSAEVGLAISVDDPNAGIVARDAPFVVDGNLFRPITDGFGTGEDARDVYRTAIEWWDVELSRLETELAGCGRSC